MKGRMLSPCVVKYASALENPFKVIDGACIPDMHSIPSYKMRYHSKGTFTIGTSGVGFIAINAGCQANNVNAIFASTVDYNGTVIATAGTGVTPQVFVGLPYASTSFGNDDNDVQGRLVGCGLRIRYIGTKLNEGGRVVMARHPTNKSLVSQSIAGLLSSYQQLETESVSTRWRTCTYRPVSSADYEYKGNNGVDQVSMAALVQSSAGNEFEYEVVSYYEFAGQVLNPTRTHSDIAGLSAIRNSLPIADNSSAPGASLFNQLIATATAAYNNVPEGYIRSAALSYASTVLSGNTGQVAKMLL